MAPLGVLLTLLLHIQDVASVSPLEEILNELNNLEDDHTLDMMFGDDEGDLLQHAAFYNDHMEKTVYDAMTENRAPARLLSRRKRSVSLPTVQGVFYKFRVEKIGTQIGPLSWSPATLKVNV